MKLGAGRSVKKLDQQLWLLRAWILKGSVSGEEERMNPGNLAKKINRGGNHPLEKEMQSQRQLQVFRCGRLKRGSVMSLTELRMLQKGNKFREWDG